MLCPICRAANALEATICRSCGAMLDRLAPHAHAHALAPGTLLRGGHWRIEEVLGQGGFGITYRGRAGPGTAVAIKECFPSGCVRRGLDVEASGDLAPADFAQTRQKFLEEAQILARFDHVGIVNVRATFEENNTAYMVMDLLEGQSLSAFLPERGGRLSQGVAVGIIEKAGAALEEVHKAGLLHCDIKPDNIMVVPAPGQSDRIVLIDFGSARDFALERAHTQAIVLTPGYAPLEQYGRRAERGIYTDVYALAATLYHLLTGEAPTPASDRAAGVELVDARRLNSAISDNVAGAMTKALSIEVDKRPQSVREFLGHLAGVGIDGASQFPASDALQEFTLLLQREPRYTPAPLAPPVAAPSGKPPPSSSSISEPLNMKPLQLRLLHTLKCPTPNDNVHFVKSLSFSCDSSLVAGLGPDFFARVWDVATGRQIWSQMSNFMVAPLASSAAVAFSPDPRLAQGRCLAMGTNDSIELVQAERGVPLRDFPGQVWNVNSLAFSPDGTLLACGSGQAQVLLWRLDAAPSGGSSPAQAELLSLRESTQPITTLAFSPDGTLLAGGGWDKVVYLWNAQTGFLWKKLLGHRFKINSLAFSPDGTLLASASWDRTVQVWDVRTATLLRTIEGFKNEVTNVSFLPASLVGAGHGILTLSQGAGNRGETTIWDAATGKPQQKLLEAERGLTALTFAPDGRTLATGGLAGGWLQSLPAVKVWRVE